MPFWPTSTGPPWAPRPWTTFTATPCGNRWTTSLTAILTWRPSLHFARSFDYSPFISMMVEEPFLREFFRFLRPGCYLALATNRTTTTRAVLTYHGLADNFDLVVSAQDVSYPKPHPESFVRILEHFCLSPQEAIYIGDSRVDEQFAANAGVPFVAYRNPGLTANYHLDSFAAGPDLIRGLVRNQAFEPRRKS